MLDGVLEKLTSSGYKITPQRRLILEVIAGSNRHLTAEEVADRVKEIHPSISLATIYRNINLLVKLSLLSKLDLHSGPPSYELFQGHGHHLVCLGCGAAVKLGLCPMQGDILKVIEDNDFQVSGHHFEITGYCKECQAKMKKNKP